MTTNAMYPELQSSYRTFHSTETALLKVTNDKTNLSFKPYSAASQTAAINAVECCIEKVREWMIKDKLMINDNKTEFILIGTRQHLCKLQPCAISVGHDSITARTHVKNLGCWLDSHLNMSKHVTSVCKSAFFLSS